MHKICTFFALLLLVGTSCTHTTGFRTDSGETWGTFYNIKYRSPHNLHDSIVAVMKQVDESLSAFNPTSTVSRINRGESLEADSLFRRVFVESQHVSALSGNHFDPTVGPLVSLWGFGYREAHGEPTDSAIQAALASVGIADCFISDNSVIKKSEDTEFDFSAIAKGLGCDLIAEMFRRNGCSDFMIEIGGELTLSGVNDHGDKWHIQIDAPVDNVHRRAAMVDVTDCGVASSGNYRRHRTTPDGRRIGHTISPKTGHPFDTPLLSATIIAHDAMRADALATACMAMPLDEARNLIATLDGVSALFIIDDGKGGFTIEPHGILFTEESFDF